MTSHLVSTPLADSHGSNSSCSEPLQDVYAEDLVHRLPGDTSTLASMERGPFEALARSWVAAEAGGNGGALEGALEPVLESPAEGPSGSGAPLHLSSISPR